MKNLKEEIEARIKKKGITKELIYSSIGMTKQGFNYALDRETLKLKEFSILASILDLEPNKFFEWENNLPQNSLEEPKTEYRLINKDVKNVSVSEVEFLRGQIAFLNRQIDRMNETINNLTAK